MVNIVQRARASRFAKWIVRRECVVMAEPASRQNASRAARRANDALKVNADRVHVHHFAETIVFATGIPVSMIHVVSLSAQNNPVAIQLLAFVVGSMHHRLKPLNIE